MRNIPENLKYKLPYTLQNIYKNFEKYEDSKFLSETLKINVKYATQYFRDASVHTDKENIGGKLNCVIAALPNYCGECYMVISYNDRIIAAEAGLEIRYV